MPEDLFEREGVPHNNTSYVSGRCRCEVCSAAHAWAQQEGTIKRRMRLDELSPSAHGRLSTYTNWGCRCDACRTATRDYKRARRAAFVASHEASLTRAESVDQPQSEMVCDLGFTHIVVS